MLRFIKLAIIGLAILLTGCASGVKYSVMAPSIPAVSPDQGRVFFYRPSMIGAAVQPAVHMDNVIVGDSKSEGFFFVDTNPGNHLVSTATEVERTLTFNLDPGETKYVKTSVSLGLFVGHVTPELVNPEDALKELPDTKYTGTPLPTGGAATAVATRAPAPTPAPVAPPPPVTVAVAKPVEAPVAPVVASTPTPAPAPRQQQYAAPYSPSEVSRAAPAPVAPAPVAATAVVASAPVQTYSVPDNNVVASNNTQAYATTAVAQQPVSSGEFRLGESSYTVEKLARQSGCDSKQGAALISEAGPVENYRMTCVDGKVFVAHCEFRQCSAMQFQ